MRTQSGAIAAEQLATVRALPRPLEITSDTNRGNCLTILPNQILPIIDVANPCTGPAEPVQIILVAEQVGPVPCAPPRLLPQIRALLTWGVGRTSVQAEIDVLTGTSVAIPIEVVKIDIFYRVVPMCDDEEIDGCIAELPAYNVWALLGYGTISRPQLTEIVVLSGVGDQSRVVIPPFARELSVLSTDGGPLDISLVGAAECFRTGCKSCGCGERMPIWNGAAFVDVTSRSERTPTTAALIFHLSF